MLLSEWPHVTLHKVVWIRTSTGRLVPATGLDMRFENARADGAMHDEPESWAAPLEDGSFIIHTGSVIPREQLPSNISVLPPKWYEYVMGLYGGTPTKAAKDYLRRGEQSQEEIDKNLNLDDLLDVALTQEPPPS